ncbi:MAG: translesion error-prone DNA polymerase V autoproteolytic subunit [Candidatus Competibacteraceae bacterium]|nr:translesion error-prone DNA polymerase V autoproteolytic subunit [Candidatus Competibacteraceae bacterium]
MKQQIPYRETRLELFPVSAQKYQPLPLMPFPLSAGFPSPALDFTDNSIDLNNLLIAHPSATYFGRVQGNSMKNAGIHDGDLLIIDKSIAPENGKIAVCYLNGEFTIKRIQINASGLWLMPENEQYKPIKIEEDMQLTIWGVVTYIIKKPLPCLP